jgi:hypothetical protein
MCGWCDSSAKVWAQPPPNRLLCHCRLCLYLLTGYIILLPPRSISPRGRQRQLVISGEDSNCGGTISFVLTLEMCSIDNRIKRYGLLATGINISTIRNSLRRSILMASFWIHRCWDLSLHEISSITSTTWTLYTLVSLFLARQPQWTRASSFVRFLDYTQRRTTTGRDPIDECSVCPSDLYLTTHNIHKRHPCRRWDSNPQSQQASGRRPTP